MTDHPAGAMFASGVLAGWLMGLLSWLVAAGRDTISQIVIVWIVTTAIGFAGLASRQFSGRSRCWPGRSPVKAVTAADVGRFLLWTTLGNAVGGTVFVGVIKYGHARPEAQAE